MTSLEAKIPYVFKDSELLQRALRHKSHANEERGRTAALTDAQQTEQHNERLEFLGDSVLGLVISDLLSEKFPRANEGILSRMRAQLVRAETLALQARRLELGTHLYLGKGELATGGAEKESILSSAYEALIGALYLDGGFAAVFALVSAHFTAAIDALVAGELAGRDAKTSLQEFAQARFKVSPVYQVVGEAGPDHEKTFEVKVRVGEAERYGKGRNKKEAEQHAAGFLLDHLRGKEERI